MYVLKCMEELIYLIVSNRKGSNLSLYTGVGACSEEMEGRNTVDYEGVRLAQRGKCKQRRRLFYT